MRIADLAQEAKINEQIILDILKKLKLRAKDGKQELNVAVEIVVRDELEKQGLLVVKKPKAAKTVKAAGEKPKAVKKAKAEPKKAKEGKAAKAAPAKAKTKAKGAKEEPKEEAPAKDKAKEPVAQAPKPEAKAASKPAAVPVEKTVQPAVVKSTATPRETVAVEEKPEIKPVAAVPPKPEIKPAAAPVAAAPVPAPAKPESPAVKVAKKPEPFITVKPLLKKRKRPHGRDDSSGAFGQTAAPGAVTHIGKETAVKIHETPLDVEVKIPISVKDLAVKFQQKTNVILKKLLDLGIFANINQFLDDPIVEKLAQEFGVNLIKVKTEEEQLILGHKQQEEDPALLKTRAPVVTFMGHVDHGKTSLLDWVRKSKVVDSEHGGITQHIGAYSVQLPKGRITFLDTPGHEAFTAMRARGAHITDLVVLVVAADEGVMPQTVEALDHARAANVPIVVALNKIDKKSADPDRVKKQLMELGLNPEDWGGKTVVCPVSAVTGQGMEQLLEMLLLEAELLELKANYDKKAQGVVVEAHISRGKGVVVSLIVQSGILHEGDVIVTGPFYGKLKAMFDDRNRPIHEAGPSMPVEVLGLSEVPEAGEPFYAMEDEHQAREIAAARQEKLKIERLQSYSKITLEDLYSQIQQGKIRELNVILKADVQGSCEALRDSLDKLSTDEVKIKFIHSGVGDVNASDVVLAVASSAIIIRFNVGVDAKAKEEMEKTPVDIRHYRLIYDAVNECKSALEGLLAPKIKKNFLGRVEIRQVMKLSKGIIAGCYVVKGKIRSKAKVDIIRNGEVVFTGQVGSLKRFKDDVKEVAEGFECGVTIDHFTTIEAGDLIEAFELESIARKL